MAESHLSYDLSQHPEYHTPQHLGRKQGRNAEEIHRCQIQVERTRLCWTLSIALNTAPAPQQFRYDCVRSAVTAGPGDQMFSALADTSGFAPTAHTMVIYNKKR